MKLTLITKPIIAALAVVTLLVSANTAQAQTRAYNWVKYGLSFAIPTTHTVKQNTADAFESGDSWTWLELYPYMDYSATAKGMIMDVADTRSYTIESEGSYVSGGYDGYWIRCKSPEYPAWKFWIIGFIDPTSATNFYAIIWWKDGNDAAYKIAYDMSYSFKKMNQ